jgi:hypothetical protein
MTPARFKEIRRQLGLSTLAWGRALGYRGQDESTAVRVRIFESGGRPIPPAIGLLAEMYARHGVPKDLQSKGRPPRD